jgi:SAM-dependent methyltransferase
MSTGYLHGYTDEERARLQVQAQVMSPWIHRDLPFATSRSLVELGCGTGAQLALLLDAFPALRVTGIDRAVDQLAAAADNLAPYVDRSTLRAADATDLPFPAGAFDAGFLCWILEHLEHPDAALRELHRVLAPGAPVVVSEVVNTTLFLDPPSPHVMRYWSAFNEHQRTLHGDPDVGAKLGRLLHTAGFHSISLSAREVIFDDRDPAARAAFCGYCKDLLGSAAPGLVASGRITEADVAAMRRELDALGREPGSIFFYVFVQARCIR